MLVAALVVSGILAACGSTSASTGSGGLPGPPGGPTSGTATTPTQSVIDLSSATAARPVPSDTRVALDPELYSNPGNPCAVVAETESVGDASAACGVSFIKLGASVIPGRGLVSQYSFTPGGATSASVQHGVDPQQAIAAGNAFSVSEAVRAWAISLGAPLIVPTIDGQGRAADAVYAAITAKPVQFVTTAPCVYAKSIRIVTADNDVQQYMKLLSWPSPSDTAVVATYDTCDGLKVAFTDGTSTQVLAHTQPVSIVITGHVATFNPFGPLWVEDGWAPCGATALTSVCG